MPAVVRLLTLVDLDAAHDPGPGADTMSVSAQQEAVLSDGRRVVLLDGRGWTATQRTTGGDPRPERIWEAETVAEMERTARVVVGPDEPFAGRTQADMEASHWEALAGALRAHDVDTSPAQLAALPHDVELSRRVLARLSA